MYSKKLLIALIIFTMMSPVFVPEYVIDRAKSIFTIISPVFVPEYVIDRTKSIIDASQVSNSIRLELLTLGTDYLTENNCWIRGTGANAVKSELKKFVADNPESYPKSFVESIKLFPGNFHNSYLQMIIESGLFFALLYLSSILYLFALMAKKIKKTDDMDNCIMTCAVICSVGFLISQFFHEEFFRYGGLVAFICFYSGCMVENQRFEPLPSSNNANL